MKRKEEELKETEEEKRMGKIVKKNEVRKREVE